MGEGVGQNKSGGGKTMYVSIYSTLIAIVLRGYNSAFLYHMKFSFIL